VRPIIKGNFASEAGGGIYAQDVPVYLLDGRSRTSYRGNNDSSAGGSSTVASGYGFILFGPYDQTTNNVPSDLFFFRTGPDNE
jgi:hypothetical protein